MAFLFYFVLELKVLLATLYNRLVVLFFVFQFEFLFDSIRFKPVIISEPKLRADLVFILYLDQLGC